MIVDERQVFHAKDGNGIVSRQGFRTQLRGDAIAHPTGVPKFVDLGLERRESSDGDVAQCEDLLF